MTACRRLALALALALAVAAPARADEEGWMEDFEAAKKKAEAEGKDLLIDFTGSDWCHWCIQLKNEVFAQESFRREAPKQFVLVELDFPKDKAQSEEIKAQNLRLQGQFAIEGFPTIYLADAKGRPYARTGYQPGGPEVYLEHLAELRQQKTRRDEIFARADAAEGAEKAKALDEALVYLTGVDVATGPYADLVEQILSLDAKNEAGLKAKYEGRKRLGEVEALLQAEDLDGAIAKAEAIVSDPAADGGTKQMAHYLKAYALHNRGDRPGTVAALKAAVEAAPDSEKAAELRELIGRLGG